MQDVQIMKLFEVKSSSSLLILFVLFSKEKPASAPGSRKAFLAEKCLLPHEWLKKSTSDDSRR